MIDHLIEAADPHAHTWQVTLTVPRPAQRQRVSLPVWIPGSYLVREFARHLSRLQARQGPRQCHIEQLDKCSWRVHCEGRGRLQLRYEVYAFDTSVRAAYLDAQRGFFNGTGVFLRVDGRDDETQRLRIGALPRGWQVATAMDEATGARSFSAASYAELVDHPVELGRFWRGEFELRGVPHAFVVAGALPSFDGPRLLADTRRICETQMRFWHGRGKPPMARYVFMLNAVGDGHGGLEHRASTALIAPRRNLPRLGMGAADEGYVGLLGLISHEYFHTWNVKRLKPREFEAIDFGAENYTRLLWFFEGFTSYYDDLLLLRAGLVDAPAYLRLLAKSVNAVRAMPGRRRQSVADASFDAWVKYYRGDENTPNATVSYYAKGALVALACDLSLRAGGRSLDELMRALWQSSGGAGIDETDIAAACRALGGVELERQLHQWVDGIDELPLAPLLRQAGVEWRDVPGDLAAELGLRLSEGPLSGVQVKHVLRGGAAERAGVHAGDELLAVDGWRVRRLDEARHWLRADQPFELLVVRDQRLTTLRVSPSPASGGTVQLALAGDVPAATLQRRRAWLGA